MSSQWIQSFGRSRTDTGDAERLGQRGAALSGLAKAGLPVPPGFILTTGLAEQALDNALRLPPGFEAQLDAALAQVELERGARLNDPLRPLALAVRPSLTHPAPVGISAMLNLGVSPRLALASDAPATWKRACRFAEHYAERVLGANPQLLQAERQKLGISALDAAAADAVHALTGRYAEAMQETLPEDPRAQLLAVVRAMLAAWRAPRTRLLRQAHGVPESAGLAITVQAMAYPDLGETSGSVHVRSRDPASGVPGLVGTARLGARTVPVATLDDTARKTLARIMDTLEHRCTSAQTAEFIIEAGHFWLVDSRPTPLSVHAALKVAVDMVGEGLISREEAVLRIEPASLDQLLHPTLDPEAPRERVAHGLAASPGAAAGIIALDGAEAERYAAAGRDVILVRQETTPDDIRAMHAARGIITARGGLTSHAAMAARGMGRPCVTSVEGLAIDMESGSVRLGGQTFGVGTPITIDGSRGDIFAGLVPLKHPEPEGDFAILMQWADERRRLKVRTNAETPEEVLIARRFGAEGVGLCRTEQMFFNEDRIIAVRQMILAPDQMERRAALAKLLPLQRGDFAQIFRIMAGLPCTIRLLDPPLHEFLPTEADDFADVAAAAGVSVEVVRRRVRELTEANPMLGHRGCRLGITYPEIYEMQARAIFEAAIEVARETGQAVSPEVMVPFVTAPREMALLKAVIDTAAQDVFAASGRRLDYQIGVMIELPRAALLAGEIAQWSEFFSFGTNDLTQMTLGLSRDDAGRFLSSYVAKQILEVDPFVSLDISGVGELIRLASERGVAARPNLRRGICGEHGGDPASIAFCEQIGLDYISCSPFRVPIARLAAAQAALRTRRPEIAAPGQRALL